MRIRRCLVAASFVSFLGLSACAEATTPANPPPPSTATPTPAPLLAFDEVSFVNDGKVLGMLHADGKVEQRKGGDPRVIGAMFPDGRLVLDDHRGKTLTITLDADGKVHGLDGKVTEMRVDAEGTAHLETRDGKKFTIRVADDGSISGLDEEMKTMRVQGMTARSKRAVGFLLAAVATQ